jgi:protein-L-isoaspartate(D-aspartate) O-methyltransferase
VLRGDFEGCEHQTLTILDDLLRRRLDYASRDGERFFEAERNAQLVANAERYYRAMYYGSRESWNLRDRHMFDTLAALLEHRGPGARAVVWAHNSHLGDARATEMGARGELNLGELCRTRFGEDAYLVGFGTDHGTVAAAHDWDGAMEVMQVRPSHPKSYERVCHDTALPAFLLPLRTAPSRAAREALMSERLERAIGVIYRPRTEVQSHYFYASLPQQFDEWIWFDETRAVDPLPVPAAGEGLPETWPFGV